jgi:hypothetical protein
MSFREWVIQWLGLGEGAEGPPGPPGEQGPPGENADTTELEARITAVEADIVTLRGAISDQTGGDQPGPGPGPTPPPTPPAGGLSDDYETIGSEGWEGFNALNPKLKDGTTIAGSSLWLYYDTSMSWAFNTGLEHTNIETTMAGEGRGMYNISRSGSGPWTWMMMLFRLTGDLRLLDRLLDGLDAAWGSPYRTTAWVTEYWVAPITNSSNFSHCDYPSGPNDPWSPYNKWVSRESNPNSDNIYQGTDLRFERTKMATIVAEAAWVLHVNRNKTSPAGRDYAAEAEKWTQALVDYFRTWSEDSAACWAGNYRSDQWVDGSIGSQRAAWGEYPVFASVRDSHLAVGESLTHWYYGMLGLNRNQGAALDIPNPQAAIDWAHEWAGVWWDRGVTPCTTEWGPSLASRRFWVDTSYTQHNQSVRMTYSGLTNRDLVRLWFNGNFRATVPQADLQKYARANAAAHRTELLGTAEYDMCHHNTHHNCGLSTMDGTRLSRQGGARGARMMIGIFEDQTNCTRLWDAAEALFDARLGSIAGTYENPTTALSVWMFAKKALEASGDVVW